MELSRFGGELSLRALRYFIGDVSGSSNLIIWWIIIYFCSGQVRSGQNKLILLLHSKMVYGS